MNNLYGAAGFQPRPGMAGNPNAADTDHKPVGMRESELDRLQSALERADHPRPNPSGIPLSQQFDPNAYLLSLDSEALTLESLRRSSGASAMSVGAAPQVLRCVLRSRLSHLLCGFGSRSGGAVKFECSPYQAYF